MLQGAFLLGGVAGNTFGHEVRVDLIMVAAKGPFIVPGLELCIASCRRDRVRLTADGLLIAVGAYVIRRLCMGRAECLVRLVSVTLLRYMFVTACSVRLVPVLVLCLATMSATSPWNLLRQAVVIPS